MTGKSAFRRAIQKRLASKSDKPQLVPGLLGAYVGGQWLVKVPNRSPFCYVRVHGNNSEVVEAFNDSVSPVLGLSVVLTRDELTPSYYRVLRRDIPKYPNWNETQLSYHAVQHQFGGTGSSGRDVVWVQKQQFVPLEVRPIAATGTYQCYVDPEYYEFNGIYKFFSGSSTPDFSALRPTGEGQALFATVYLNGITDSLEIITGSPFAHTPWPDDFRTHIPNIESAMGIPLAGILLTHEMAGVYWNQIYDIRAFLGNGGATGTVGAPSLGWFNVMGYGAVGDGITDDTDAINSALVAANASNGGIIYFPANSYLALGAINIPNDGAVTPHQKAFRFTGPASSRSMQGVANGGAVLDLRCTTGTSKLDTRGIGCLEIDHLTLTDGGNDNLPFLQTTNTTLYFHDNFVIGTHVGILADQDAIILGGISAVVDGTEDAPFQGYGTVINNNVFSKIRRLAYGRTYANALVIQGNFVDSRCGSNLVGGAAIEFAGITGAYCHGNYIVGNNIEIPYYPYGIKMSYATVNNLSGNCFFDPTATSLAYIRFEVTADYNFANLSFGDPSKPFISDANGNNTFLSATSVQHSLMPTPIMFGSGSPSSQVHIGIRNNTIQTIIQGNLAQTFDLLQFQNSAGAILDSVSAAGNVGIGAAAVASYKLYIAGSLTGTSQYGLVLSPILAGTTTNAGISCTPTFPVVASGDLYGLYFNPSFGGVTGGPQSYLYGLLGYASIAATATQNVSTLVGAQFKLINNSITGSVVNSAQAIHISNPGGVGLMTNVYGIYVEDLTKGGSTNYTIYTNAGLIRFGDAVDIAGIRDTRQLMIRGYTGQTYPVGYIMTNSAVNSATREALRLEARVDGAGVGANGLGNTILWVSESATNGTYREQGKIDFIWATATDASRKARGLIYAYDTAARECVRVEADGSQAMLGLYGVNAVARQVLPTGSSRTTDDVISMLQALGACKQS